MSHVPDIRADTSGADFRYFVEWGGRSWEHLCRYGLDWLGSLQDKRILEIGPRYGRLSSYFALMGGRVTGIETDAAALRRAEKEVRHWGVESRVSFIHYDGDLDHCDALRDAVFDVVFTKSVLVLLGNTLADYLLKLNRKLSPTASCVFLENGDGGPVFNVLRRVMPHTRHYRGVTYFTGTQIRTIGRLLNISEVRSGWSPPVYLILATKSSACGQTESGERSLPPSCEGGKHHPLAGDQRTILTL
jgi:SAM-dependent methyltransferase